MEKHNDVFLEFKSWLQQKFVPSFAVPISWQKNRSNVKKKFNLTYFFVRKKLKLLRLRHGDFGCRSGLEFIMHNSSIHFQYSTGDVLLVRANLLITLLMTLNQFAHDLNFSLL